MSAGAPFAVAAVAVLLLGPGGAFAQTAAEPATEAGPGQPAVAGAATSEPCRVVNPATGATAGERPDPDAAAQGDIADSPVANPSPDIADGTAAGPGANAASGTGDGAGVVAGTLDETASSSAWQSADGSTAAAGADGDCALVLPR